MPETTVEPAAAVLEWVTEQYSNSAKAYAAAPRPDSSERVFHRIRLGVLQQVGDELSTALGWAEPDWEFLRIQAGGDDV